MGKHIIDAFIVTLSLETAGFKSGEREISDATKRLRENNKRAFSEMENRGKSAAAAFKGIRNEVIGLSLAFMGAQSITGLITNMMTGAASAERLGRTMGMTTEKIWSWRMAMKANGGQIGDADSALSSIQRAKMGWIMSGDSGNNLAFSRLGISAHDLQSKDPGAILRKLSEMQARMDPQVYASLLQQIGLPASTVAFLQQGKASVDKLLAQFEKDADGQAKLAKETEDLQKSIATLEGTIIGKLVPPLVTIANALNRLIGGESPMEKAPPGVTWWNLPVYTAQTVIASVTGKPIASARITKGQNALGGHVGSAMVTTLAGRNGDDPIVQYFMSKGLSHDQALGIRAGIEAEGGLKKPLGGGYKGRAIGIGQLLGSRRAEFLKRYGNKFTLQNQLDFMWWELQGGDPLGGGAHVLRETSALAVLNAMIKKFYRPKEGFQTHRDLVAGATYIRAHRHPTTSPVHQTNHYHIRSTDPKAAAQEVSALHRRSAVSQADRGVAP